jgi:hypothetical protein
VSKTASFMMLSKVFNGFDRLCRPPPPGGGEARGVEMLETQGNSKVILGRQPCCPITHFSWYVTQSRRKKPNDTSRNGSVSLPLQSSQVPPLHRATAARPGRRARMSSRHGNTSGESPTRPPRLRAQARWRGAPIVRFWVGARPDHSSWRLGQPQRGRGSPSNYVSGEACH